MPSTTATPPTRPSEPSASVASHPPSPTGAAARVPSWGAADRPWHRLPPSRSARRRAVGLGALLLTVVAVAGGVGVLYLIRHVPWLAGPPTLSGALPLQQLAGEASQPLARLVVAWLPAGLVAGFALGTLSRLDRPGRAIAAGSVAAVMLVAAGAGADAVAISGPLAPHVLPQLGRTGTWAAVALFAIGTSLVPVPGLPIPTRPVKES